MSTLVMEMHPHWTPDAVRVGSGYMWLCYMMAIVPPTGGGPPRGPWFPWEDSALDEGYMAAYFDLKNRLIKLTKEAKRSGVPVDVLGVSIAYKETVLTVKDTHRRTTLRAFANARASWALGWAWLWSNVGWTVGATERQLGWLYNHLDVEETYASLAEEEDFAYQNDFAVWTQVLELSAFSEAHGPIPDPYMLSDFLSWSTERSHERQRAGHYITADEEGRLEDADIEGREFGAEQLAWWFTQAVSASDLTDTRKVLKQFKAWTETDLPEGPVFLGYLDAGL